MIRVLHFARFINRYDIIDTVLTEINKDRFEVACVTVTPPNNRTGPYADHEKYPIQCLDLEFKRSNYRRIFAELRSAIERFRPHILQTHHFDETVMGAIARRVTKTPGFVIGHHYSDHIYVLTKGLKRAVYFGVEKLCNDAADKIVVPTEDIYQLLARQGTQVDKLERIPFGIDLSVSETVSDRSVGELRRQFELEGRLVAFVGCRLSKEKGLETLLRAVPEIRRDVPKFSLIIAGSGAEERNLKELAASLDLNGTVQFIGWRMDSLVWYALCDLVIQPSLSESFGQVLTEALTFGKPVVMTPVGVAPEIIVNDERGGELVLIDNVEALATAVKKLITNQELRLRLGNAGKNYVSENFSTAVASSRYEDLYTGIRRGYDLLSSIDRPNRNVK